MSNPTELLPDTGIASTSFELYDQDRLYVYTQDIQGNIRQSLYARSQGGWVGGTSDPKDFVVKAKPNSPIAVVSSRCDELIVTYYKIRLYYISPDNLLRELSTDSDFHTGWDVGDLDKLNIPVSPVSRLAVTKACSESGTDLSLFYQRPDGAIGNIYYNGPIKGSSGPPVGWVDLGIVGHRPLFGTGLAAAPYYTRTNEYGYNQVFYQLPDGKLALAITDQFGKWSRGSLPAITSAATATNISCWASESKPTIYRLYFLDRQNNPIELVFSDKQWSLPKRVDNCLPVPGSGLAATQVNTDDNPRLYVQDDNNVIQEYQWDKKSNKWSKGVLIPVGNLQ